METSSRVITYQVFGMILSVKLKFRTELWAEGAVVFGLEAVESVVDWVVEIDDRGEGDDSVLVALANRSRASVLGVKTSHLIGGLVDIKLNIS